MLAKAASLAPPGIGDARDTLAQARYRRESGTAFLTGIQALVRLPLDQRRLDAKHGLDTAGFISGYRGSPLGGLDKELWRAEDDLKAQRIVFAPGVNEDLAATAVWGSQQVGLFSGARYDGVFGMWYGKAPGLDRSSDALRHANAAGVSPRGGVLLVVGDDHACKSSTLPNASEFALRDLGIPVLAPADVQDVLDFGLAGWAMSRYAGCWVALVALADVMDSALTVDVGLDRHAFVEPPPKDDDPHIRLIDSPLEQEARLQLKERLAVAFAGANGLDRVVTDPRAAQLLLVTAGKAYADVREAFAKLGLGSDREIASAGVRLLKLGMTWPLNVTLLRQCCEGVGRVLVVEEKRAFIEEQLKASLFGTSVEVLGKGNRLPATGELDVPTIAAALATVLARVPNESYLAETAAVRRTLAPLEEAKLARKPLYCAGCPHNTSTRVPNGSRAGAGIGCHYMAQWMGRETYTVTHMGAEGANWIGQAPFTDEGHIFVNLGDGTYFHSGILAIRAAVAAGVDVTYKVLANDAVAMTGGQPVEGSLTVGDIVAQVRAEGVAAVRVVSDDPRRHRRAAFTVRPREELDAVQRELRATKGCTVLIYDQTCAAELRRRRKRGLVDDPDVRVVINDAVCEGCGDCSRQSNCVAVAPLATELGVKRTIDQSACNKDLSCLTGLCPALVTLQGAEPLRVEKGSLAFDRLKRELPLATPTADAANILIAGVGGTGVVTVSQLLGTAAHLDGKYASTLDMTGLAQKGGAVLGHVRISAKEAPHPPTRIPFGSADFLIAADLVTASSRDALALSSPTRTLALVNSHVAPKSEFVLCQRTDTDSGGLRERLASRVKKLAQVDANATTKALFGNNATANVFLLGHAYQTGAIPVSLASLERAITLNGVAVAENLAAFHAGRAAAHDARLLPEAVRLPKSQAMQPPSGGTLAERIAWRRTMLVDYQDDAFARRYESLVNRVGAAERRVQPGSEALTDAVAESYFKLLAAKDEYEVARLFTQGAGPGGRSFAEKLAGEFAPGAKPTFHFAPPLFARKDANGRPKKIAVGPWILPLLRAVAAMKRLRGGFFDPFRHSRDRRLERRLLARFEADFETIAATLCPGNFGAALALARLPDTIKGFGPVKEAAAGRALAEREDLIKALLARSGTPAARPRPITDRVAALETS